MRSDAVGEVERRWPAIPWSRPIRVHFTCNDEALFACRLCILRFGLKSGDDSRLFRDERDALAHIGTHAGSAAA